MYSETFKNINYSRKLLKGKIGEFIFERMFLDSKKFSVIPLGYEKTVSVLAQSNNTYKERKIMKCISTVPDYALIPKEREGIYLVEVKYRKNVRKEKLKRAAEIIYERDKAVWLFVASPNGFFFSTCKHVVEHSGEIEALSEDWIELNLQNEYLDLLKEFVK